VSAAIDQPAALANWTLSTTGDRLASRSDFCAGVGRAIGDGTGFAAGKLGVTERALLNHQLLLAGEHDARRIAAFEQSLAFKAGRQAGVFPVEANFLRTFSAWYAQRCHELDFIGLVPESLEVLSRLFAFHGFDARLSEYRVQEPDMSERAEERPCYLPHLRGRTVLLVCPFAEVLRSRADRATFERVWSKTGKQWFHPAEVKALELPYGFDPATQRRYPTVMSLFDELAEALAAVDFDVALIAAGGLGIPLAAAVKEQDKVAISLGGPLQVLFGVLGERWRRRRSWQQCYFNRHWIDLPERYRPDPRYTSENYW